MSITVTSDIHLSAIQRADRDDIVAHLQDREVSRYTLLIPHPYTAEHADEWLAYAANDVADHGRETLWAIREKSGRLIGGIELSTGSPGKTHCAEVGYWLAKPFWGRGIMTTVVKSVVDHGFCEFGILRVTAPIFTVNAASGRVLEKAGFIVEAPLLRKQYHRDRQFFDGRLYARVRDE